MSAISRSSERSAGLGLSGGLSRKSSDATEANAGDEHRILVDRRALWAMSRELTKWGYHYNQAVHAMNLINFHARHGHVDRDLVADSIPTIERELADVNAAAREMAAELGRMGADSLVEGSPCRS